MENGGDKKDKIAAYEQLAKLFILSTHYPQATRQSTNRITRRREQGKTG